MPGLTEMLAAHAASRRWEDLSPEAAHQAARLTLDAVGCAFGGARSDLGRMVTELALAPGPSGSCTLLAHDRRTAPVEAAFANAHLINALDYDDTDHSGHPGSSTLAAALAAAELVSASGRQLLLALAVGQRLSSRLAAAIKPSWERYQQVHGVGSAQTLGAAVAAGSILGLDAGQMADACGIAGAFAPVPHAGKFGWEQRRLSWVKDNVGRPAEGGLRAALLARAGFPGNRTILEGDKGFWAMAGSDRFDPTPLTRQLEHWDILDLSFKPYPCCRWIHTTLDALASLPIPAAEVQSIEVQTISSLARTFTDPAPATMIDAQFSVPYACACLLLAVAHRDWHSSLHDPRVLALAARTRLVEDPEAQTRYLAAGRLSWLIPTRVIVRLADGRVLQNSAEVARGSAGRPLSDTELIAKFQHLVEPSLGEVRTARLADALLNLASLPDVRRLLGRFGR